MLLDLLRSVRGQLKGALSFLFPLTTDVREQCNHLAIRKLLKGNKESTQNRAAGSAK